MAEVIKFVHDGVEIVYSEDRNQWLFNLRGRDRSAESLAKAKEAIDKPVADPKKEFKRIPAIRIKYMGEVEFGEITSIAEGRSYSNRVSVWFVVGKDRSKEELNDLYADNPQNRALVDEMNALRKESNLLDKKADHKQQKMAKVSIEIPE